MILTVDSCCSTLLLFYYERHFHRISRLSLAVCLHWDISKAAAVEGHQRLSLPVIPAGVSARLMLFAPGLLVSGSTRGPEQVSLTKSTICTLGLKNEMEPHK